MAGTELEIKIKELGDSHAKAMADMRKKNDELENESKSTKVVLKETSEEMEKLQKSIDEIEIAYKKLEMQKISIDSKSEFTAEQLEYKNAIMSYISKGEKAPEEMKAKLIAGQGDEGGYLCPIPLEKGIQKLVTEMNPIRQYCRVTTLSTRVTTYPVRTSNLVAKWSGEQGDVEKSASKYGVNRIECHGLDVIVPISKELLQDSQENMETEIQLDVAEAFADAEGAAFVLGDGVSKPSGFMNSSNIERIVTSSSGAISSDDLLDLMFALKTSYVDGSIFAGNRQILKAFRKLKGSDGHYLLQTAQNGKIRFNLLDTNFVELPAMSGTVAGGNDILAYGNFSRAYRIVDRSGMDIIRDPYTAKVQKMVEFQFGKRVGGDVNQPEGLKVLKVKA